MGASKQKGDISEIEALRYYMSYDWTVSIPFGDNARFDLVVHPLRKSQKALRIQVKTMRRFSDETLIAELTSNTGARGQKSRYRQDEVDEFFLFWPGDNLLEPSYFRVSVDKVRDNKNPELVQTCFTIRTGGKGQKNSHWSKDFLAPPADFQHMELWRDRSAKAKRLGRHLGVI